MAQIPSEGAEQDSQPTSDQNGTGETAETGKEGQAVPDPKQKPGDNNEKRTGMDVNSGRGAAAEQHGDSPSPAPDSDKETTIPTVKADDGEGEPGGELSEPGKSPVQGSLASSTDSAQEGSRVLKQEQREGENVSSSSPPAERTKTAEKAEHGTKRRASVELTSSDGEPLSRMDSEDSIGSTLMDMEHGVQRAASTPAHGQIGSRRRGVVGAGRLAVGTCRGKSLELARLLLGPLPLLFPAADPSRNTIQEQRGCVCGVLWKACKDVQTPAVPPSQSWLQNNAGPTAGTSQLRRGLQRHMLPSQGGVARPFPTPLQLTGFRSNDCVPMQGKTRPPAIFASDQMDACPAMRGHLPLQKDPEHTNRPWAGADEQVIARRTEDSGKVKVLLHWTPEDILPDVWVNESDRLQQKTKVVHLSKLPTDTAVLLDPNIYRMFF
ncbi:zinc finger protein AEBP2-like [Morone saxatilis]|uniref:zinc finger protein AEBP2-like n=1 Tax=Morone saxatilis TaxID=34816 RepID=UPI0015E22D3C|nr:zinc finger protein AEBP2-like [Morone saxatilis]